MASQSHRKGIAMALGWWYVRRQIRKRGTAAVATYLAGEGLSLGGKPKRKHPLRWLLVLGAVAGAGFWWWRRQQGGGDDWGDWEPVSPVTPAWPAPEPEPLPHAEPVAT